MMKQAKVVNWNRYRQTNNDPQQNIMSVLLVVHKSSGLGRTTRELNHLQRNFHYCFRSIARRIFAVTEDHDEIIALTQDFLTSFPGPWLLISGGGGGTNRAVIQGLLMEVENGTVPLNDIQFSTLRLGSGNLLPRQFNLPKEPLIAMQCIAADLLAGRNSLCCAYRCTFHYPDDRQQIVYGITMGGIGHFGRVPGDIKSFHNKHARLVDWMAQYLSLESINTWQYMTFSLLRAIKCIIQPAYAELIEVKHEEQKERFRLFSGVLINFDFPQLPFQGDCRPEEPRLVLCLIPQRGRWQTMATLLSWPDLNNHICKYEIRPDYPLDILFLENETTIIALDEDTFVAPNRISFEIATLIKFVSGDIPIHK